MKPWRDDEDAKLIAMHKSGKSVSEMLKHLPSRTSNALTCRIHRLQEKGRVMITPSGRGKKPRRPFTDEDSLKILDMHENKRQSFPKIAKKLGRSSIDVEKHYREIIRDLEASERL